MLCIDAVYRGGIGFPVPHGKLEIGAAHNINLLLLSITFVNVTYTRPVAIHRSAFPAALSLYSLHHERKYVNREP